MTAVPKEKKYTYADIEALPEGERAELIDGQIYYMASPSRIHQRISGALYASIYNHINARNGKCEAYSAPFAVWLYGREDDKNYLEPDISVVCDPSKLTDEGCSGAPDFILEIVSPSTASKDYLYKLNRYKDAGVREYWIVNPEKQAINVFSFETGVSDLYTFSDIVESSTLDGFTVRLADLL